MQAHNAVVASAAQLADVKEQLVKKRARGEISRSENLEVLAQAIRGGHRG